MALSARYVAREAGANLWRNRLMTSVAILTVFVTLALAGSALLLRQAVATATIQWQNGVSVIVFVDAGATSSQSQTIYQELVQIPYVKSCIFRTQAYDFAEAKRLVSPVYSFTLSAATTPSSYRCVLDSPSEAAGIVSQFHNQPNVKDVSSPAQAIKNIETFVHVSQWVLFILAFVLLLSATVLILNTIRLAIFARRREVAVMKLVGATNWFIRIPFMCEGLVQGLVGAVLSLGAVFALNAWLHAYTNNPNHQTNLDVPTGELTVIVVFIVLVGIVIGMAGSAFAVRRFLDT
jgi:cell division transport system permease protein